MEMPPGPPIAGRLSPPAPQLEAEPPPPLGPFADEARNRRLVRITLVVAIAVVLAMLAGFLARGDNDGDGVAAAPEPRSSDPSASTVPGTVDETELEAVVDDLRAFVEEERGLTFNEEVELEVLDPAAYMARVRADVADDIDEDRENVQESAGFFQALGLWPAGLDPIEVLTELSAVGSLGFYDPDTGAIVVRGDAVTPLLRVTVAHELTHALDDQHFGLDRPALDDRTDESSFAFSALVEGNASRVDDAFKATLTSAEQDAADAEELELVGDVDPTTFPGVLLLQQQFIYETGPEFVEALLDDGGNRAVNRALRRPPTTSEQIQEPDRWLDGEGSVDVGVPESDEAAISDGVGGQFVLDLLTTLSRPAGEAVPEWDGDHAVLWRAGPLFCVRWAIEGDIEGFESGLAEWADTASADLTVVGDQLIVENCL